MRLKNNHKNSRITIPNSNISMAITVIFCGIFMVYYYFVLDYYILRNFGVFGHLLSYLIIFLIYLVVLGLVKATFQIQIKISEKKILIHHKVLGVSVSSLHHDIHQISFQDTLISIASLSQETLTIERVDGLESDFILIHKGSEEIIYQDQDLEKVFDTLKNELHTLSQSNTW